jgi:hypothetical protein
MQWRWSRANKHITSETNVLSYYRAASSTRHDRKAHEHTLSSEEYARSSSDIVTVRASSCRRRTMERLGTGACTRGQRSTHLSRAVRHEDPGHSHDFASLLLTDTTCLTRFSVAS